MRVGRIRRRHHVRDSQREYARLHLTSKLIEEARIRRRAEGGDGMDHDAALTRAVPSLEGRQATTVGHAGKCRSIERRAVDQSRDTAAMPAADLPRLLGSSSYL
jgi:hypothetical protein